MYFTAQATHLEHLSRKFEESVDKAMALSVPERHKLQSAALARRFPVADMMQQYADAWVKVGCVRKAYWHCLYNNAPQQRCFVIALLVP